MNEYMNGSSLWDYFTNEIHTLLIHVLKNLHMGLACMSISLMMWSIFEQSERLGEWGTLGLGLLIHYRGVQGRRASLMTLY